MRATFKWTNNVSIAAHGQIDVDGVRLQLTKERNKMRRKTQSDVPGQNPDHQLTHYLGAPLVKTKMKRQKKNVATVRNDQIETTNNK